jgi:hypothetical protein
MVRARQHHPAPAAVMKWRIGFAVYALGCGYYVFLYANSREEARVRGQVIHLLRYRKTGLISSVQRSNYGRI